VHHLVDVDLFDVVAEDQLHDIFEDAEVLVAVFTRDRLAHEAADDGKSNDRHRDRQNENPSANLHRDDLLG
jgi:hypothetical protein